MGICNDDLCQQVKHDLQSKLAATEARVRELEAAAKDALSGWRYIRGTHGDLYGVGWDRVESELIRLLEPPQEPSE